MHMRENSCVFVGFFLYYYKKDWKICQDIVGTKSE